MNESRKQFEDFLLKTSQSDICLDFLLEKGEAGEYTLPRTQDRWLFWESSRVSKEYNRIKNMAFCVYFNKITNKDVVENVVKGFDIVNSWLWYYNVSGERTLCWEGVIKTKSEAEVMNILQPYLDKLSGMYRTIDIWEECED